MTDRRTDKAGCRVACTRFKMLFLAFDRIIFDNTTIESSVMLWIHDLLHIRLDTQTTGFSINGLRNHMKNSVNTSKPPNQKIHASATCQFLSKPQYSHGFEFMVIWFIFYEWSFVRQDMTETYLHTTKANGLAAKRVVAHFHLALTKAGNSS